MEFYDKRHPFIMPGKHPLTKMLIEYEHARLLHAGPTLVAASPGDSRLWEPEEQSVTSLAVAWFAAV